MSAKIPINHCEALLVAAEDLVQEVDGPWSERWTSPSGRRLKDTGVWVKFYVVVANAARAKKAYQKARE